MISFAPIWAIVLRHLRLWRKDLNCILMTVYWPLLDILIWGFLGSWVQQTQRGSVHNYELLALLGVLLWQLVGRGSNNILLAFNEELWSNNIVNLCSLPLRLSEWILGIIIFHVLLMGIITFSSMLTIFTLYQVPVWFMIKTFFIFAPPLFLSSVWLGFTALQVVVTFGKRSVEIGYVLAWCFMPFSGAYYPIDVLPLWAQKSEQFSADELCIHGNAAVCNA